MRYGHEKCQDSTPSDPEYLLLSLMSQIGEDSESDDDFDGWLDDDHRERDDETGSAPPPCRRSMSLESLDIAHECSSLTYSPMQLSTLSPTASPTNTTLLGSPTRTTLLESPTSPTGDDNTKQFIFGPPVFITEAGVIPDTEGMVPVEFFRLMFSDRVFHLIYTKTRRYASQYLCPYPCMERFHTLKNYKIKY